MPGKTILETPQARDFASTMDDLTKKKYAALLQILSERGFLQAPFAEIVEAEDNLFALRILTKGNYRYFYCYDTGTAVIVLSGYSKKTNRIPSSEKARAIAIRKELGL